MRWLFVSLVASQPDLTYADPSFANPFRNTVYTDAGADAPDTTGAARCVARAALHCEALARRREERRRPKLIRLVHACARLHQYAYFFEVALLRRNANYNRANRVAASEFRNASHHFDELAWIIICISSHLCFYHNNSCIDDVPRALTAPRPAAGAPTRRRVRRRREDRDGRLQVQARR